jgi:M6 family metalloprotease-like protein
MDRGRGFGVCGPAVLLALVLLAAAGFLSTARSMEFPTPGEVAQYQRSGELADRAAFADAIGNHKVRSDLLHRALRKARSTALSSPGISTDSTGGTAIALAPPRALAGMPTKGNVKVFALLIDFPDYPHANASSYINDRLFGIGNPADAPIDSLASFYRRSSYGQLELAGGATLGWYRSPRNRSAIPQTISGREGLIREALNYFQGQGHDFSVYDNDGDGSIDYFLVVWSGADSGWGGFWWGYQTEFYDATVRFGGKRLDKYSWQWESRPAGGSFTPLAAIHETGHALGLPDYYDYDDSVGPRGGVGRLDMMDGNLGDHNCFSKWMLEWITPTVVASGRQAVSLRPSATTGDAVLVMPGISLANTSTEFFMVQNRIRTGNDVRIPGDGLLVWHVDATLDAYGYDFLYNNSSTSHKLLRLMEADGFEEIERGIAANAGDFYLPGMVLGRATMPSSVGYGGGTTDVMVSGIARSADLYSAVLSIGRLQPAAPQNGTIRRATASSMTSYPLR